MQTMSTDPMQVEGDFEEDYELSRQRKIKANEALIASLGLLSSKPLPVTPKPRLKKHKTTYDRDGYVTSLPAPGSGKRHRLAAVLITRPRGYRSEEFVELKHLAVVFNPPRPLIRDPIPRSEPLAGPSSIVTDPVTSAYQGIPGPTCHQCKRRSYKLKMICRSTQPLCRRAYCTTCIKRYTSIIFEEDSRSFICPFCQGTCNCRHCLLKRGIKDVIRNTEGRVVQEVVADLEKDRIELQFTSVRLVNSAEDVVIAESSMTAMESRRAASPPRKYRRKNPPPGATDHRTSRKLPPAMQPSEKLMDTDGETVGGGTDDESIMSTPPPSPSSILHSQALVETILETPSLPDPSLTLVSAPQWESAEWAPNWTDSMELSTAMEVDRPPDYWPLLPVVINEEDWPSEWPEGASNLQILASAAYCS